MHDTAAIDMVRRHAVPVDLEPAAQRLLEAIDPNVSLVLIGEATHGRWSSIAFVAISPAP